MILWSAVPAVSSCPIPAVLDRLGPVVGNRPADLRRFVERVPDPRCRRGVRHSLASIVLLGAAAVAGGSQGFTAVGEGAAEAPQRLLELLGARFDPRRQRYVAPDESTLRRVVSRMDGDHVDAMISDWLADGTDASRDSQPLSEPLSEAL